MSDLAEFLMARIAEDETGAVESCNDQHPGADVYHSDGHPDLKRLAECDAKRRIVEEHKLVTKDYAGEWWTDPAPPGTYVRTGCTNCTDCGAGGLPYINDGPCATLRLLALPYADHADYRQEWKP